MTTTYFAHKCVNCSKEYQQRQSWIDPAMYTNPEAATLTTTFWCPKCEAGQALVLRMLPDQKVEVAEPLNYGLIINERSPSYYSPSGHDDDDDEKDERSITEKRAMEILSALK